MLTIGFSLSTRIKLLERSVTTHVKSISSLFQGDVQASTISSTAVAEATEVIDHRPGCLRISKTTFPEKRLDFNDTFEHIRCELDALYKARNPIFDNIAVPSLCASKTKSADQPQQAEALVRHIDGTLEKPASKTKTVFDEAKTPALWVSKTILPNERLDFNETFRHIRSELDEFYKERNPLFDNTINPVVSQTDSLLVSPHAQTDSGEHAVNPRPDTEAAGLQVTKTFNNRSASHRSEAFTESWVGIPAVADL